MVDSLCERERDMQCLVSIMARLRAPDGCPWDREQTHGSIRANLIEETYEALEAIDTGNDALLCEELGDVLLQVVFHAQMAAERGAFDIDDVVRGLCTKLIERHAHVFGDIRAENADEALSSWETQKNAAKPEQTARDKLRAVPAALPALMRADKLMGRAEKAGWTPGNDAPDGGAGRQLWDAAAAVRAEGLNPELALREYCDRFVEDFTP